MPKRRKMRTVVVRRVTLEARYQPGDGWPSDAELRDDLTAALEGEIVEDHALDGMTVVSIETTTERVAVEG